MVPRLSLSERFLQYARRDEDQQLPAVVGLSVVLEEKADVRKIAQYRDLVCRGALLLCIDATNYDRAAIFHQRQRKSRRHQAVGGAMRFLSSGFATRGLLARVAPVAGGAIALAAACSPAEPTALAADQEPAVALAQDQLPDGWSLGRPLEGVAKCCFIGGVWVPCHPGWETRGFPIQRGTGPEARPYSRTITIAKNDMEESIELEFWVVVSAGEGQSGASGDGR